MILISTFTNVLVNAFNASISLLLYRDLDSLIQKLSLILMKHQRSNRLKTLGILVRRKVGANCFGNVENFKPV